MKKYNSLTVKELLDLEDGYYNLMSPIPYVIRDDGEGKELDSVECQLEYGDEHPAVNTINITPSKTVAQLTIGNKYHVKLRFSSGFIAEKALGCIDDDGTPVILFDADMFDNLYTEQPCGISVGIGRLSGILALTTPQDENRVKYGDSVVITITELAELAELNGIVRIITDVSPSGITKIITTMNDNMSCFVENVLQDGDVLSVIATDKDAGSGGGDEDEKFKVYLAGDGSVDTAKTGMSSVDVYNELIKHDDGNKKIKNCVIIFDDGTELTEGLVNIVQVHAGEQIKEQRVPLFPIDDDSWWQIGEDGYGSFNEREKDKS